ncbi:hypothetical protein [Thalassovita sp.]|uniref:AraC-like ligand-binding domain-containing protein n=1 Tax=Thalassovita sp. TaxID=1979401 RepID=UPI002881B13E|nr:hypothetical protein [Thalassovita sp.]MDF1802127.1 hypothetical protein [Thalassovita sp.]
MNLSIGQTGTSVVNMRAFDPDIVGSIIARVDLSWSRDARAKFVVSSLGNLSLIRSTHTARNSKSRRLERHMSDAEDGYYFACMPLSGGGICHLPQANRPGRSSTIQSGHVALLNTNDEYEIAMSDSLDALWLRVPLKLLQSHAISVDEVLGRPLDIRDGLGLVVKQMMYSVMVEDNHLRDRGARIFS